MMTRNITRLDSPASHSGNLVVSYMAGHNIDALVEIHRTTWPNLGSQVGVR